MPPLLTFGDFGLQPDPAGASLPCRRASACRSSQAPAIRRRRTVRGDGVQVGGRAFARTVSQVTAGCSGAEHARRNHRRDRMVLSHCARSNARCCKRRTITRAETGAYHQRPSSTTGTPVRDRRDSGRRREQQHDPAGDKPYRPHVRFRPNHRDQHCGWRMRLRNRIRLLRYRDVLLLVQRHRPAHRLHAARLHARFGGPGTPGSDRRRRHADDRACATATAR